MSSQVASSMLPQKWSTKFTWVEDGYFLGAFGLVTGRVWTNKRLVNGRWHLVLCQAYVDYAIIHI